MGFDPHGEVFWGYDLGDLTGPVPDGGWPHEAPSIAPAWMGEHDLAAGDEGSPTEHYGDWEEALAVALGWVAEVPWPELPGVPQRERYEHPDFVAWRIDQARMSAAVTDSGLGCRLDGYGTFEGEFPDGVQLRVAIAESVVRSSYDCVPFSPGLVSTVILDWCKRIDRFCALLDIVTPAGGPGWHLTSDYG